MKCNLCNKNESIYTYILEDKSDIKICQDCGSIVYGKEFKPIIPGRLFQIILMIEYVKLYKSNQQKLLLEK